MNEASRKIAVYGLAVAVLLYLIILQVFHIRQLEKMDFGTDAKEKMQESLPIFDRYFSEVDSLQEDIMKLLSQNVAVGTIEKVLQMQERHFNMEGVYIIPSGNGNVALFSNDHQGFRLKDTDSRRQEWFSELGLQENTTWGGPVFDSGSNRRIVYCCIPFVSDKSRQTNIIYIYDAQEVYRLLHETGLTRFGVPYMMDSLTHFIAHPLDETRSLLQLAYDYNDKTLIKLSNDVINNNPLDEKYLHFNTVTRQICDEKLLPIHQTGWLLGLSVYDGVSLETAEYQKVMRQGYMRMIICGAILLFLIIKMLIDREISVIIQSSYVLSPIVFLTMTISIVIIYNRFPQQSGKEVDIGHFELSGPGSSSYSQRENIFHKWDPHRIVDKQSLNGFIDVYQQESVELYNESAKIIPTGMYIYSMEFLDSHGIKVTGTFWQKYLSTDGSYPEEMRRLYHYDTYRNKGLFFPGAHVATLEQTDSLEIVLDNYPAVLYRWNFDIEIEQQLSYSLYPFGKNEISLALWSKDLDDNTVLTPDLNSYRQIYPNDRPGLDNRFHIRGWDTSGSYYSYRMESYLCNFGNSYIYGINQFPELMFNISISRKFIDILICKIVPLTVILVLLFTILFVREKSDGFNNIIGCSGLFFVLVLDHINLRESVLSEQIMYLEFCYFFSYILLLLITITSFDISRNGRSYNAWVDNVLKHYFWTIIFGAMTMVTISFFY